jgi:hypothetical protein
MMAARNKSRFLSLRRALWARRFYLKSFPPYLPTFPAHILYLKDLGVSFENKRPAWARKAVRQREK